MFVNPKNVLSKLGLRDFMKAADFGSGSGSWVLPLAEMLEEGSVFAVDVQEEPLSALSGKAKHQDLNNIITIVADLEEKIPSIKDDYLDLVLVANTLFQVEKKSAIFKEAKRVLKKGGKLLIVDWSLDSSLGPKIGKTSPKEIGQMAKAAGFDFIKEIKAGDHHFALLFVK